MCFLKFERNRVQFFTPDFSGVLQNRDQRKLIFIIDTQVSIDQTQSIDDIRCSESNHTWGEINECKILCRLIFSGLKNFLKVLFLSVL